MLTFQCADLNRKLSLKDAQEIKALHQSGQLSEIELSKLIIDKEKKKVQKKDYQNIKISNDIVTKYFDETSSKNMEEIIVKALEKYFRD